VRKGDHIYFEGTLVSSTYEEDLGKGKSTMPLKLWRAKADSIRKLDRAKKEQVSEKAPLDAQTEEIPF
jgi:hypothetical protein